MSAQPAPGTPAAVMVTSSPDCSPTVPLTPRPAPTAAADFTPKRPTPQTFDITTGNTPAQEQLSMAEQMETALSYDALTRHQQFEAAPPPLSITRKSMRTGQNTASRSPSRQASQMHPESPGSPSRRRRQTSRPARRAQLRLPLPGDDTYGCTRGP